MLVLSRQLYESIEIGEAGQTVTLDGPITVTITGIHGGRVYLAVTAPRDVAVHREEVRRRINNGEVARK